MATVKAASIETAIYERLTGALTSARAIAAGTYESNEPQGLAEWGAQIRALETPRVSLRMNLTARQGQSPGLNGNIAFYTLGVEIVVSRVAPRAAAISQDTRSAVTTALMLDNDVIRQALEYQGVLSYTAAGDATDIVSGMLRFESSALPAPQSTVDEGAQRYEMTLVYSGVVITRPAITF